MDHLFLFGLFFGALILSGSHFVENVFDIFEDDGFPFEKIFGHPPDEWNSEVQTPILFKNHMFAVGKKKRGLFTCLDLDGKVRWTWDHYRRYTKPIPEKLKHYHPRSYDRPHFGGGEVAVAGRKVVTAFGWDQVCLEDAGAEPKLVWCNRAALGKDAGVPAAASIAGGWVYTAWPGVDGAGSLVRFSLADGSFAKGDQRRTQWAIFACAAVRGRCRAGAAGVLVVCMRDWAGSDALAAPALTRQGASSRYIFT